MARSPALLAPLALATLAAFALGCGAGPAFDGRVVDGGDYAFQVGEVPAGYRQLDTEGAAIAFRDDAGGSTIAATGRCGQDGDDVPLASLTQHLFIQFTEREIASQDVVPMDGREAMHTVLSAKLDGVPKRFDVWVVKKDGCVFDLVLIADAPRFEAAVGPFRTFVSGFATVRTPVGKAH
jgi:hypothetical protein